MAEIFHARFDSDADGFSAGTQTTGQGSAVLGDTAGALTIGASVTASRDFANITTGDVRFDCWAKESNTTTAANTATIVYLLPNAATVVSGNTTGCISVERFSANGAVASAFRLGYRDSTGFVYTNTFNVPKGQWYKLTIISRIATKTFDIALDDIILMRGLAWANAGATAIGRVAFAGASASPDTYIDNVRVESDWTEDETVLVNHDFVGGSGEIEASTPTTSLRDAHAQPWLIPSDTTNYGAFTLGADGAVPDASNKCFALQRCGANGIIECEFRTPSSGAIYFGVAFRFWDYFAATGAGSGLLRVFSGSNTANLFLPGRSGNSQTVQTAAFTPTTNTTYTLRIEMRGRVLVCSIKTAAMDSGSYTTLYAHTVTSSATGGRGMLVEELAGPYVDTSLGSANVRRFRYTGKAEASEASRTVGGWKYGISHGSVKEAYALGSADDGANLFWSRGIQYSHRSSADMVGAQQQATIYDSANVYAVRQTGGNVTEYQHIGKGDAYVTLLHRGPWISDGITVTDTSENFAPDWDLRPSLWSAAFLTAINSGSATSRSDSPFHDWVSHNSSVTLPAGNQSLTAFGSGQEYHVSQVVIPDGTVPSGTWFVTSKNEGAGDPISRAISVQGTSLAVSTSYRVARAFLMRAASALDGATLTAWRDALASPGTLSFTTGSAKTDAEGDTNADGFNERHGWYEVNCSGGGAEWTLPVASGTRHFPVFRLHGWTNTNVDLNINGSPAVSGTDYVIDDLGGSVAVLQVLADYTADVDFEVTAAAVLPPLSAITATMLTTTGWRDTITAA
jgi:hypothetical protein